MRILFGMIVTALFVTQSMAQIKSKKLIKGTTYEEVDLEDMMRRYFGKEKMDPLEGIYSVSCVITTRTNRFLSKRERIKVVERKDNYARVAIIGDWPGSKREYIEVSLSFKDSKRYPIVGEINGIGEGHGYMYRHLEPDGAYYDFSMLNESVEMLESEFSVMEKRKTITYRLSYLKIYPKPSDMTAFKLR